jgi:hypothetical protein
LVPVSEPVKGDLSDPVRSLLVLLYVVVSLLFVRIPLMSLQLLFRTKRLLASVTGILTLGILIHSEFLVRLTFCTLCGATLTNEM